MNLILSILSAILLSLGFLLPHCGGFALIAFVPLLIMDRYGKQSGAEHFWLGYLSFIIWNTLTTFWVCNATVAGGIFAVLANALQMAAMWEIFRFARKKFEGALPYIFLAAMWIAFERRYFAVDISWPWLTLGNAFARTTTIVQWYEYTGLLGGSLWVWMCNLCIFGLFVCFQEKRWDALNIKAKVGIVAGTALLFTVPVVVSLARYASFEENIEGTMQVRLIQPNIDPYHKFESLTQKQQNSIITQLMSGHKAQNDSSELLIVAPETICHDITVGKESPSTTEYRMALGEYNDAHMLFGASTYEFMSGRKAPSYTARPYGTGMWYETHNSAMMIDKAEDYQIYHKSKLVVGTELMPYPRIFSKIDKMLGGVMAHCTGQDEVSLLYCKETPLGCAVCYESVYPEHFASYVRKGAQAMAVITNDSWWGSTPGYKQHLSYSRLRAIETRRDIARSANTGISAFINQRGDIVEQTAWWEKSTLDGEIHLSQAITPFVKYGDIVGRICTLIFFLTTLALLFWRAR